MTAKELGLSQVKVKRILSAYSDLKDQAEFYGMEIDFETLSVIPKQPHIRPSWYDRWIESRRAADFNELTDMERE